MRERMCDYGYYNGLYVGGNLGYVDHMTRRTDADGFIGETAAQVADVGNVTGGVQAGYNWQSHCTVWGIEADWQWSGADAHGDITPSIPQVAKFSSNMEWFSTVRGRYGIMVDQTLLYGTVGFAFAQIKDEWTFGPPALAFTVIDTFSNLRVGLAAGVGLEYAWSQSVSLKAEALYLAFTDHTNNIVAAPVLVTPCNCAQIRGADSAIVARAGINVKLGQWFGH